QVHNTIQTQPPAGVHQTRRRRKKAPPAGGAGGRSGDSARAYFLSGAFSLASWAAAWWPAIESADMNGAAAAGAFTSPMRTLRNPTSWPYMAVVESESCSITAPSRVRPANAPLERE